MTTDDKEYPSPPENIRVLKNGAGYDMTIKRITYPPGTFGENPNMLTGSELARVRWDNTKRAINDAIVAQAQAEGINVTAGSDAIAIGAGALYREVLTGSGTLRDRNKVLWDIAKHSGNLPDNSENVPNDGTAVHITMSIDVIRAILDKTGGQVLDNTRIIDGQFE